MTVNEPTNPVIDPIWYAKELATLNTKLSAEFPGVPGEAIEAALGMATAKIATTARIPNYVPVLVGREARALLSGRPLESDEL